MVIPALNEHETIGLIVKTFLKGRNIGQVIVVSDLSKDRTSPIARKAGALVVKGPGNGKGAAMRRGLQEVKTDRVIFADADLYGLTVAHVNALSEPVFGMLVGFRDLGRFNFLTVGSLAAPIAGERSLPTSFVKQIPLEGYGAETQINQELVRRQMRAWHFIMLGVTGRIRRGPLRALDVAPYVSPREFALYHRNVKWLPPVRPR